MSYTDSKKLFYIILIIIWQDPIDPNNGPNLQSCEIHLYAFSCYLAQMIPASIFILYFSKGVKNNLIKTIVRVKNISLHIHVCKTKVLAISR